jgi:hypothetical protein
MHDPEPGQRRQRLDTSSPSASSSHSRRDFKSGSFSDSGFTSRTPHSTRRSNLSSHSPHLSLLHARHHSPSSPNLPIANYFSDGDRSPNLLQPSRLDVKRLLSKPAAPSINSTLSITSESEPNALPRAQTNSNEAWPSKTRMQVHFQPSSTPTGSTEQLLASPQPSLQLRPRNLLRKRSASKQNRATLSATLPDKTTTTASALQPRIRSPTASSRSEFSNTTLQFVIASRAAVPVSAPPHGSSSKLTPAGAIAQAYKEQDLRREALAAAARAENLSTVVTASGSRLGVPDSPTSASGVGNGMPYYTVFGSSSDRVVTVGGVEDKSFDAGSGSNSNSASTASASQPIKSLTRKVSARFRRGRPSVSKEAAPGDEGGGEHDLPRSEPSSPHEHQRSASSPKVKSKFEPLRLSFDQRNLAAPFLDESLEVRSPRPVPSEDSTLDVVDPSPTHSKGKQKQREDDTGAGGRLWRLVKRISVGGLRERFHTTSEPVPPVPPIPAITPDLVPSCATLEVKVPITPISVSRSGCPESRGAGDVPPSTTCGTPSEIPTSPQGPSANSPPKLPSISSSSPQSSEPTSTHFFRSHSSRSSFSSMFCGSSPPLPASAFAQASSPRSRSRAKSISSSPPTRPSFDGSQKSPRARPRKRSSPDIPAFSVSDVINNFIIRRPSLVRRPSNTRRQQQNASARSTTTPQPEETSTPPPRPPRSDLRNAVVHPMQSPGPSVQSNDSHSSSSTERAGSASASTISAHAVAGTSANAGSVARLTFREIGGTRRQAWTSQEKEDKWDDLLKKSARAGGTLHLDTESVGLPSDNMRFSSSTLSVRSDCL